MSNHYHNIVEFLEKNSFELRMGRWYSHDNKYSLDGDEDGYWSISVDKGHYGESITLKVPTFSSFKNLLKMIQNANK